MEWGVLAQKDWIEAEYRRELIKGELNNYNLHGGGGKVEGWKVEGGRWKEEGGRLISYKW